MSNDLALSSNIIRTFDDAERAARAMSASGFFPDSKVAAQAIVKILAGQELGFGPFASMTGVSIIQGKPTIGANLMAAAVKRTGKYNYRVIEMTDNACEIAFFEGGQDIGHSRFTMDDAKKASLNSKDNWTKYPRNMLFARALSNGQRWYAPDVFNGALVYTPDELGQTTDEDGNAVIEAQVKPAQTEPKAENGAPSQPAPEIPFIPPALSHLSGICSDDGTPYPLIPTDKLSFMFNSLEKALKQNNLEPEVKREKTIKRDAAQEIMTWRKANPAA